METIIEQMALGFQKLYAVADVLPYGELEQMRKEVLFLTAAIENRQAKLREEALRKPSKRDAFINDAIANTHALNNEVA